MVFMRHQKPKTQLAGLSKKQKLSNWSVIQLTRGYYRQVMPDKKGHRIIIWVVFLLLSGIVAGQLLYPPERSLPLAYINGERQAYKKYDTLAEIFTRKFEAANLHLITGKGVEKEYSLKATGAEPQTDSMIARLDDYPIWQRLIPFSILWQRVNIENLEVYYSDHILEQFAQKTSRELSRNPTNARLALKDGELVITPEGEGTEVEVDSVKDAVSSALPRIDEATAVMVPAKTVSADVTTQNFEEVRLKAETALARAITITAAGQNFTPSKKDIASWLKITSSKTGVVALGFDRQKATQYLETINKKVGSPAGQTNITIVDGFETGRTEGKPGKAIDKTSLINQIEKSLFTNGQIALTANMIDVPPSIIYNNKYTSSQAGLQAYLNDVSRQYDVRIMVHQLAAPGWTASVRANESTVSGSTYKLFVALMLFDKMKKGETNWGDPMLDTTVSGCFDRMTIASTNPCAEAWLAGWGRQNVNNFIYANGFSSGTTFTNSIANHTTAADLTKYMIGLENGSLVSGPYRERLLHSLGVHPYQEGVPSGSKSPVVYNKVGFLWDYTHDTAIVRHPKGTYVVTIMTRGASYWLIASITREIEAIMYP